MKTSLIAALSVLTLGAALPAQGNRVLSNNQPYYVICTCTCPATGFNRIWMYTQPPEFDNGGGPQGATVPAGTRTFKIFRYHVYARGGQAPAAMPDLPQVDGITMVCRLSACTPTGGAGIGREPAITIEGTTTDTSSSDAADLRPNGQIMMSLAAQPGTSTGTVFRVTRTFNPVTLDLNGDFCMTADWAGGENSFVVATPNQPSQGTVGSWQDGDTGGGNNSTNVAQNYDAFGFQYPGADGQINTADDVYLQGRTRPSSGFYTWLTFLTAQPSMAISSDWGNRRNNSNLPTLFGHSLGSYHSDLGTLAANGGINGSAGIGFAVRAGGPYANGTAIPFLNMGPVQFPGTIILPVLPPSQNVYLKLSPADPLFGAIAGPIAQTLDGSGNVDFAGFPIPQLPPALIGWVWDWQVVVVDAALTTISNTERRGIVIER